MNENIKILLEKIVADEELQAKFAKLRDPDEVYKLAISVQPGYTKEEFITEMKKIYEESMKDLSEDDIAKVAGGVNMSAVLSAVIPGAVALSAAAVGIIGT